MVGEFLAAKKKGSLKKIYESLEMIKLREEIEELLDELMDLRLRRKMKFNWGDKNYDLTSVYFKTLNYDLTRK